MKQRDTVEKMRSQEGVALIITIGILMVLTIIATAFATRLHFEHLAARNYLNGIKAGALAEAGIERAIAELDCDTTGGLEPVLYEDSPSGLPAKTQTELTGIIITTPEPLPDRLVGHYLNPDKDGREALGPGEVARVFRIAGLKVTENPPDYDNELIVRWRGDLSSLTDTSKTFEIIRRGQPEGLNYFQTRTDSLDESWATGLTLSGSGTVSAARPYELTVSGVTVGSRLVGKLLNPDIEQEKTFTIIGIDTGGSVIYTDPADGPMPVSVTPPTPSFAVYWAKDPLKLVFRGVSTAVGNNWLRVETGFPLGRRLVGYYLNPKLDRQLPQEQQSPDLFRVIDVVVNINGSDPALFDNDIVVATGGANLTTILPVPPVPGDEFAVFRRGGEAREFDVRYSRVITRDPATQEMDPPVPTQLDETSGGDVNGHVIRGVVDEDRKINVNLANAVLLEGLPDIGSTRAQKIIDWRDGPDGEPGELKMPGVEGSSDDRPFKTIAEIMSAEEIGADIFYGDDDGKPSGTRDNHVLDSGENDAGVTDVLEGGIEDLITVSTAPTEFDITPDTENNVDGFADGSDPVFNCLPGVYDSESDTSVYYADVDFDGDGEFDYIDTNDDGDFDYRDIPGAGTNTWDSGWDEPIDIPIDLNNYRYNTCPVNVNTAGETVLTAVIAGAIAGNYDQTSPRLEDIATARKVAAAIISYRSGEPVVDTGDSAHRYAVSADYTDADENPFDGKDSNREDFNDNGQLDIGPDIPGADIDPLDRNLLNPLIPGFAEDWPDNGDSGDGLDNDGDWRGWDGMSWNDDENRPIPLPSDYEGRPDAGEDNVDEPDEAHLFAGGARGEFEALIRYLAETGYPYRTLSGSWSTLTISMPEAEAIIDNADPDPETTSVDNDSDGEPDPNCWTTSFKFSSDTFRIISTGRILNPATGKIRAKRTIERIIRR